MTVKLLNFAELANSLHEKNEGLADFFAKKPGVAYVVSVAREKCSGCEKQKPMFDKLSDKMETEHGARVKFYRVFAHFRPETREEAVQCLEAFRAVAFPTYLIYVRDRRGRNRETYRAIEPPMGEIERNIKTSIELAEWFESERH